MFTKLVFASCLPVPLTISHTDCPHLMNSNLGNYYGHSLFDGRMRKSIHNINVAVPDLYTVFTTNHVSNWLFISFNGPDI